jgi:hypothetical protein
MKEEFHTCVLKGYIVQSDPVIAFMNLRNRGIRRGENTKEEKKKRRKRKLTS